MLRPTTLLLAVMASVVVSIARPAPASAGENDFGLVITNSKYLRKDVNPVDYAHRDGEAVRKAMQDVFRVPSARILKYEDTTLSDFYGLFGRERASDGEMFNLVRSSGTHPKSRMYVYYAGHGIPRNAKQDEEDKTARAYLLPTDGNPLSPENTGYAVAELVDSLKEIKAKLMPEGQIILILEACFTGGTDRGTVAKGMSAGAVAAQLAPVAAAAQGEIVVLAASQGNQVASWDDTVQLSVFTNTLIDGLYGLADEPRFNGNDDKRITLKELHAFTDSQINQRLTDLKRGRTQNPSFSGSDSLEIVRYEGPALVRDPELKSSEERNCSRLKSIGTESQITEFLSGCRYCMCQRELMEKLSSLRIGRSACAEDRKLRDASFRDGNLKELTYLSTHTACPGLKEEMASDVKSLTITCADEKQRAAGLRTSGDLRTLAASARCLDVRTSAAERADIMERACTQARGNQWEDLKKRGMPDDLRRYAAVSRCPEVQSEAERLAERRQKACDDEQVRFNQFAGRRNYAGIRMLAERAECPTVKETALVAVDKLAREQEERCKSDEAKWAAFTNRTDVEALRKIHSEVECERVLAEIDKEIDKHKPTLLSGKPIKDCPTCPSIIAVKPACFVMGAGPSDAASYENERPAQTVRVAAPFAIGITEVTVGEWAECHKKGVCQVAPPAGNPKLPMMGVSYDDAKTYVGWLQRETGQRYRLPSEAEWEFAARAGTTTPFSFGTEISMSMARYSLVTRRAESAAPVGSYKPNAFGLFDMHGNAAELVEDCYEASHAGRPRDAVARSSCSAPGRHVIRGGSWTLFPARLRSSYREAIGVRDRRPDVGFRVAREAPDLARTMSAPNTCP